MSWMFSKGNNQRVDAPEKRSADQGHEKNNPRRLIGILMPAEKSRRRSPMARLRCAETSQRFMLVEIHLRLVGITHLLVSL